MALGAGSIGFVGFNADGNDNLAFVTFENIAAGTVITFTDNEWTGAAFNSGESVWTWTATSDIAAGAIITMDNLAAGLTATSNLGTIAWIDETGRGLDTGAEAVFAYTGDDAARTFLTAISNGPLNNTAYGVTNGTGLSSTTALNFGSTDTHDIAVYSGLRATTGNLDALRPAIFTAANWTTQNTADDDSANGGPDAPFDTTPIVFDPNAQKIFFSASSRLLDQNEGDSGPTTYTFVVERSNGTTGQVNFSGTLTPLLGTSADDFGGVLPTTFSGIIAAGETFGTVTITIAGDLSFETRETFRLQITAASNPAAGVYLSPVTAEVRATGGIVNDDPQPAVGFESTQIAVTEGDDGTMTATITVVRTGDTVGNVSFSGFFDRGGTNADDFGGTLPPASFSGVIPAGQSSVTFTVTWSGDTIPEGNELFSLFLNSVTNSAGTSMAIASGKSQAQVIIINDDAWGTIHSGETVTGIGLTGHDVLTIEQGATANSIQVAGENFDVTINNAGKVGVGAAGLAGGQPGNGKITFNNEATGEVASGFLMPDYTGAFEFILNNAGQVTAINTSGSPTYDHITVNNLAGGVIKGNRAIQVDGDTIINNAGSIISIEGGRDGIEYGGFNVVVNNLAGGWIEGQHHAVTGNAGFTITNEAGGTIVGRDGSAVNIDNGPSFEGDDLGVAIVINHGVMRGEARPTTSGADSDGDGVDVDGLAEIENWGTIEGLGHEGYHNQEPNVSEGIAIGGGSIKNHAGGTIYGYGRAIQVDNSSNASAFAATTIVNDGTIKGDGNLPYRGSSPIDPEDLAPFLESMPGGEAVNIVGSYADSLTNGATGVIIGGVKMGGGDDIVINKGSMTATGGSALNLGEGNDTFEVYAGSHVSGLIDGGVGIDLINFAAAEAVEIDLAAGTVVRGAVSEVIANFENVIGSQHDDVITGSSASNVLTGGAGEDRIDGAAGNDTLSGDAGDDLILGGTGDDIVDGGADDDVIYGDDGHDLIIGGLGNDVIKGNAGNDTFVIQATGDGRDSYDGGAGIDTLDYSALNTAVNLTLKDGATTYQTDTIENVENIIGGSAGDKLTGNALDNVLSGNAGDDTLNGGDGNDTLNGGEGLDTLNGGNGNDALNGGANDDVLKGVAGNDTLDGGEGNDDLDGGADNDTLLGGTGNDIVNGGAGNDAITGGAGNDTLTGGAGNDVFAFNSVSDGIDTITDFKISGASEDQIALSSSMFQNFSGDDAFDLIGSGFLRAVSANGTTQIQVDVDGGGDHFVTLATVTGNISNGVLADHVLVQQDQMV